jgi:long-chain fatty acid transport protein
MDPIVADWGTGWQLSLGVEYLLTEAWAVRVGYGTVFSPVPSHTYDPSLPDGRRDLICVGGGFRTDWFRVDLGYMLAIWEGEKDNDVGDFDDPTKGPDDWVNRGSPNGKANGRYETQAHLLALTLSANF